MVNLEIRGGKRRAEALRRWPIAPAKPELSKLVAVMIQTDRFGTSIADSLRTHSDFMRVRRRQEAEERAAQGGRETGIPHLLFDSAGHAHCGGGSGSCYKYSSTCSRMMKNFNHAARERATDQHVKEK